jgi:hypothetical protein
MCTYTLIASNARALFTALCMYNPSRLGIQVRLMQRLVLCLSVMTLIHFSHRAELLLLHWYVVSMFFFCFLGWSGTQSTITEATEWPIVLAPDHE